MRRISSRLRFQTLLQAAVGGAFSIIPGRAHALADRFIIVGTGIRIGFTQALGNLMGFLVTTMSGLAVCLFLVGALLMVASRGQEDQMKRGKDIMIGSLIGLAVVLGSYAIYRTVLYLIYS